MEHEARDAVHWFLAWGRAARFAFSVVAAVLSPKLYTPRARMATTRQIYFTAWQVLPGFALFATALGVVVVQITLSTARQFGLEQYALELIFRALVLELMPLLTALFVALRSGSAISTEIALMRISGDLAAMHEAGLDPIEREYLPRVLAAAVSVFTLTVTSGAITLAAAYFAMYGLSPWGFDEFTWTIAVVFTPIQLAGITLKTIAFGVAVAVIPIAAGLSATRDIKSAPVAVLGGMVRLFFALGLIEVASLAVKYV